MTALLSIRLTPFLPMLKKLFFLSLATTSTCTLANKTIELYQAPITSLNQFKLIESLQASVNLKSKRLSEANTLQRLSQTQVGSKILIRYQQLYQGIPVVGAQALISRESRQGRNSLNKAEVNGHLIDEIKIDTQPTLTSQKALDLAKKAYFNSTSQQPGTEEFSQLQIRSTESNELALTYLVSFKTVKNNKPLWPFFIIDAHSGQIKQQWNNLKTYLDSGPGGNEKTHEYWYGKDGLPALDVSQNGLFCVMESAKVRMVNLKSRWDWNNLILIPHQYTCGNNTEEEVNGAFSPSNDAYYFGHTIVNMYKEWYGLNALQQPNGEPMKLIMRVHFGRYFDNAFWDGQTMSFGDGEQLYPLVSLDVAGHEVTHGFTEQHSNLEYHDQSGALNESISDMAGQASRAYLLETEPKLYSKAYLVPNEISWGIGETLMRNTAEKALRYMDTPSADGASADCLDKALAQQNGASCTISYDELLAFAKQQFHDPLEQQDFIVHTASGVFNKAFYLLAQAIGIKKAYQTMLTANMKYWTPTTDFKTGACGVLYAAKNLEVDENLVKNIFAQVGVDTANCAI